LRGVESLERCAAGDLRGHGGSGGRTHDHIRGDHLRKQVGIDILKAAQDAELPRHAGYKSARKN